MFVLTIIVSSLLAAVLIASAAGKLTKQASIVETLTTIGVPQAQFPRLAALEVAGAVGLIVGLFWTPAGIAAAIGIIAYFVGAIATHLRANDRSIGPAAGLLLAAVIALVVRIASS